MVQDQGGNAPMMPHEYQYKSVAFGIAPSIGGHLVWNDADRILNVFAVESILEECRERWGRIFATEGGQTVGSALLGPSNRPNAWISVDNQRVK